MEEEIICNRMLRPGRHFPVLRLLAGHSFSSQKLVTHYLENLGSFDRIGCNPEAAMKDSPTALNSKPMKDLAGQFLNN